MAFSEPDVWVPTSSRWRDEQLLLRVIGPDGKATFRGVRIVPVPVDLTDGGASLAEAVEFFD